MTVCEISSGLCMVLCSVPVIRWSSAAFESSERWTYFLPNVYRIARLLHFSLIGRFDYSISAVITRFAGSGHMQLLLMLTRIEWLLSYVAAT